MSNDLSGQLLLAMPGMSDDRFDHSVIFMCAHSEDGAMGLIINKPSEDVSFADLLEQLDVTRGAGVRDIRIYAGGPVEPGRGFVLHTPDYTSEDTTLKVDDGFSMTATLDVLEDMATGNGPKTGLLALGYAGWGPGQLEEEILANGWLTCPATYDIVFGGSDDGKWTDALNTMGIDPLLLSAEAGHA